MAGWQAGRQAGGWVSLSWLGGMYGDGVEVAVGVECECDWWGKAGEGLAGMPVCICLWMCCCCYVQSIGTHTT